MIEQKEEKLWKNYLILKNFLIQKILIKPDILPEIKDFKKRVEINLENFGKAGIFTIACTKSKKMYIGEDKNNILDAARKEISKIFFVTYDPIEHVLEKDAQQYGMENFEFYVDTNSSLTDTDARNKRIKEIMAENRYYDFYFKNDKI